MTTGNRLFIVAATVEAFNNRKRMLPESTRTDYGIIPVLNDADMRGRSIMGGDLVLVCGDWSGVPHDRIQRLVGMFNSRRDLGLDTHEIPLLRWQPGLAPEVGYPDPPKLVASQHQGTPMQITGGTMWVTPQDPTTTTTTNGPPNNQYAIGIETQVPPNPSVGDLVTDPVTKEVKAWDGTAWYVLQSGGGGSQSSHTDAEVQKLLQELEDARALLKVNDDLVTAMSEQYQQLASWLSGVQPVEDSEIPGLLWCGVCGANISLRHADGCPAAP